LLVTYGPTHGAARHAVLVALGLVVAAAKAAAGDVPPVVLPVGAALAIVVSAVEGRPALASLPLGASVRTGHPKRPAFIPRRVNIPDAYSEEFERPLRSYVAPTDSDRIVSFDLFPRPRRGWMISLAYAEEESGPYSTSDQVFGVTFEYQF
jgi:hypothetical protein